MKKISNFLPVFLIIACLVFLFSVKRPQPSPITSTVSPTPISQNVSITLTFDPQTSQTFQIAYSASTSALSLLDTVARQNNISLVTKKYSFGTLVESINGSANSPNRVWIYFINGQAASVGSDQYLVRPGDRLDWKYVKPE